MGLPENADHAALNVASTVHVRGLQARPGEGSKIIGRSFDYTRATSSSKGAICSHGWDNLPPIAVGGQNIRSWLAYLPS